MSNTSTHQNLQQDDVIITRRSTLSELINQTVTVSVNDALQKFKSLLNNSTESQDEIPVDLKEGAEILGIALPTMYAKVSRREFSSYRKGKKVYVFKSELLEYLKSGKRKSVAEITQKAKSTSK